MRRLLLSCFLSLIILGSAFGEEAVKETIEDTTEENIEEATKSTVEEEHYIYKFPEIKPKYLLSAGYRLFDIKGSERAAEFEFPHDSITLNGEFRAMPFPHRIHLELDFFNRKDYFWDMSYAYKDLVLARWINKTSFHNLENISLVDLGPNPRTTVDVTDDSKRYGIMTGMNVVFLRFKTPDFPLHVYIDGQLIDKEGQRQQRFLGGSGFFNDLKRTTRNREVDWETRNVTVGVNSHLGPVEVDISHSEKRFDSGGDRVFNDSFSAINGIRAAGTFPHNLIPDFKGSTDTLKLHTSYTGKLVASMTLSKYSRENEQSNSQSDYLFGSTDVTWMPLTRLTFFLKYRHKETDIENPDTTTIIDLLNPSDTQTFNVRKSISLKTDSLSGTVRYRAFKGITVNAEVSHLNTDRENADEWNLPKTTVKDTASISLHARIFKNLNIRSKYTHEEIDEPAYNVEPNSKDAGVVSISWTPLPFLLTYLSYDVSVGNRDEIHYIVSDRQVNVKDRKVTAGKAFGMVGLNIAKNLSVETSYAYIDSDTKQSIIYGSDNEPQFITDNNVPYKERAYIFATNLNYKPVKNLELTAGINYTKSSANFFPSSNEAVNPVSIANFSELKIRQTEYNLSGLCGLKGGWDIGLRYSYSKFDNVIENPLNPESFRDGNAHIVLLSISRRW